MSKFLRQSIVPIAVIGAQMPGLLFQPQAGHSSSCLQWANEAVNVTSQRLQRTFNPPYVPEGMSEGEYNQLKEVYHTDDIRLSRAQTTAAQPPAHASASATPEAAALSPAFLPNGLTEDEYQARRRAIADGGH